MAIKQLDRIHPYGQDGRVWEISFEAHQEKRANWHEIYGAAAGYAVVEHQDWRDLYAHFLTEYPSEHYKNPWQYGPSYLVHAVTPDGKAAHLGSFHANQGKVELDG